MKKKVKILSTILGILSFILVLLIAGLFFGKKKYDEITSEKSALESEIQNNKQIVYVAQQDISHGDVLTTQDNADEEHPANVIQQERYIDLNSSNYIAQEDIGSMALIDIKKDVPIMKDMVTPLEIKEDTREYELGTACLMTDQKENDVVDVHIMFPNGVDQVVLPKKQVKNLNLENNIFYTYLTAEEIDRMASAIIDAYTISGTKIYTARYVESNIQPSAVPTYLVKSEVIDHIMSDPNVLETAKQTLNAYARMDLEMRLGNMTEDQLAAVAEGHGLTDTAKGAVLTENANTELTEEDSEAGINDTGNETTEQNNDATDAESNTETMEN